MYHGWLIVLALGITTIISYGTSQYLFGVLLVPVERDLHVSRAAVSGAYSLGLLASGLFGLPIGRLVDRRGARALMSVGSLVCGLTLIAMGSVHGLVAFWGLWAVGLGLGTALTYYPVSFTVVNDWFLRRRGAALAVLTFLGGLSSLIFVPLAGVLVRRLGWREAVVVLGLVQLTVALPLHALVLRRRPEDIGTFRDGAPDAPRRHPSEAAAGGLGPALRVPAFWTLSAAGALVVMGANVVFAHLVPYLQTRDVAPVTAAAIAGLIGASSPPSRLVLNLLSARLGQHYLLVGALALTAAGVALVQVGSDPRLFGAAVVVFGAGYGAQAPLRAAELSDHFGRGVYGTVTALQGLPAAVAGAAGPVVAGWLYDHLGDYRLVFVLTAGGFLLAAAAVLLTPPVRPGRQGRDDHPAARP